MKQASQGFRFRGFVALADMLFALSAGLLLLHPIRFASTRHAEPVKPVSEQLRAPVITRRAEPVKPISEQPPAQAIILEAQKIEEHLDKLESDGRQIQAQAVELLKTE